MRLHIMLLVLICALAGCGGLDDTTKNSYKAQLHAHQNQVETLNKKISDIESAIQSDDFASVKISWGDIAKKAKTNLEAADNQMSTATKIFKDDDEKKRVELTTALRSAEQNRSSAKQSIDNIYSIMQCAQRIIADPKGYVSGAKSSLNSVINADLTTIKAILDEAAAAYPEKSGYAKSKKKAIDASVIAAKKAVSGLESNDLILKATAVSNSNQIRNSFQTMLNTIRSEVAQLYTSWTETLSDMEIEDSGSSCRYQHQYTKVIINKDGTHKTEVNWQNVSESVFDANQDNLGMSMKSKPLGKFDNEATKIAQHAGYNYMAQPGQSNRYGTWKTDSSGNSFWEFYGQYMFMQQLLWGPSYYQPIYASDYRSYRSSYDRGRPYYGTTSSGSRRYGSSGSYTSKRYSNSKYRRSNTVKNYRSFSASKKTGKTSGSFSRSRYSNTGRAYSARQARSSYSNSSYRGSSSSGSRSRGGK